MSYKSYPHYIYIYIYIYMHILSATTAATGALLALFSHIRPLSLSWNCMVVQNLTNQREWPLKSLIPKERSRRIWQFSWLAHRVARWPRLPGDLALALSTRFPLHGQFPLQPKTQTHNATPKVIRSISDSLSIKRRSG